MKTTYAIAFLVLVGAALGLTRPIPPAQVSPQDARPESAAPLAQKNPLVELWKQSLREPDLVRTRELLAKLSEDEVDESLLEELSLRTGLWPAAEGPRAQRVVHWIRYRTGLSKLIDEQGRILIDLEQDHAERGKALIHLGIEAPHPAFLPLLRNLASDASQNYYVRFNALTAISQTPHAAVLQDLFHYIDDPALRARAWEQLEKLTRAGIAFRDENPAGMRADYERWLERTGRDLRYERDRVLIER